MPKEVLGIWCFLEFGAFWNLVLFGTWCFFGSWFLALPCARPNDRNSIEISPRVFGRAGLVP